MISERRRAISCRREGLSFLGEVISETVARIRSSAVSISLLEYTIRERVGVISYSRGVINLRVGLISRCVGLISRCVDAISMRVGAISKLGDLISLHVGPIRVQRDLQPPARLRLARATCSAPLPALLNFDTDLS